MNDSWRPSAAIDALKLRARLLGRIREFFRLRRVLEVETPVLSSASTTDPNLHSLRTQCRLPDRDSALTLYLQTSPEFAMKRLLAAGIGPIYQLARVFRDQESGRLHNPEFTMLEWYRPGFDHHALMDEVEALLKHLLGSFTSRRLSYAEAFACCTLPDPHRSPVEALAARAAEAGLKIPDAELPDRNLCLDFLLSHCVAPALAREGAFFVYDFPHTQAALARIRPGTPPLAERFELFMDGMEIANGFHELSDAVEQRRRFAGEQAERSRRGLMPAPMDEHLLSALARGLPDCSGVALGFDRLVMIAIGARDIADVLAFPVSRA